MEQARPAGAAFEDVGGGLGGLLFRARISRGMGRGALARAAGCSRQYVEMLESGDRLRPSPRMVAAFAAALGLRGPEREQFFGAAGMRVPAPAPDDRYAMAALAARLANVLPYPAFLIDIYWTLLGWNTNVPRIFEVYVPGLPAAAMSLLEIVYGVGRDRFLNWEEVAARQAACFKRDTRGLTHNAAYRETIAALRRLPGFAALYRNVKPAESSATTGLLGLQHSRLGELWLVEVVATFPGEAAPRLLAYLPADPATAAAIDGAGRASPAQNPPVAYAQEQREDSSRRARR